MRTYLKKTSTVYKHKGIISIETIPCMFVDI